MHHAIVNQSHTRFGGTRLEDVMICLFSVHQLNSFRQDVINVIFSALPLLEAHKVISNVDTQESITIIIIIVINTNQKTNMYC